MTTDTLKLSGEALPDCPGRTWFDAITEGWHDPATIAHVLNAVHEFDNARRAQEQALLLTETGPMRVTVDPGAGTVTFATAWSEPPETGTVRVYTVAGPAAQDAVLPEEPEPEPAYRGSHEREELFPSLAQSAQDDEDWLAELLAMRTRPLSEVPGYGESAAS